jgi:hypothetical protein
MNGALRNRQKLQNIGSTVDDIRDKMVKVHDGAIGLSSLDLANPIDKERQDILDWFCPLVHMSNDEQELKRKMITEGTATWIFQETAYKEWFTWNGSFLWLHGRSNHPLELTNCMCSGGRKILFDVLPLHFQLTNA